MLAFHKLLALFMKFIYIFSCYLTLFTSLIASNAVENLRVDDMLEDIRLNRDHEERLAILLPIVKCSFKPSKYEEILMTRLRDVNTSMWDFRNASDKLAGLLVEKVVQILPVTSEKISTPLAPFDGKKIDKKINLVSIMRSGDALLDSFISHFPKATISKILVQRDETTAEPIFKYMKVSSSLGPDSIAIITEPMIATGGTLEMVIKLLKDRGVIEENIIIASICTAPEGLLRLNNEFPRINIAMIVMDDYLNEHKYIVPGIGDFGDRYFGTTY